MSTGLKIRKILSIKLLWSNSFLSKIAIKLGVRKIHPLPSPFNGTFFSFLPKNICSLRNIRNLSDCYIEAKLISATLLCCVEQFLRTSFDVECKTSWIKANPIINNYKYCKYTGLVGTRGVAWSFRLGTHRKEGREPLGGSGKKFFSRGSEMPFPMFSRGKFHKSKHEKTITVISAFLGMYYV